MDWVNFDSGSSQTEQTGSSVRSFTISVLNLDPLDRSLRLKIDEGELRTIYITDQHRTLSD